MKSRDKLYKNKTLSNTTTQPTLKVSAEDWKEILTFCEAKSHLILSSLEEILFYNNLKYKWSKFNTKAIQTNC